MPAVDVNYQVSGSGLPGYFTHGIGSRESGWDGVVDALNADYNCVCARFSGTSSVSESSQYGGFSHQRRQWKIKSVVNAMRQDGAADILSRLINRWFSDAFAKGHPEASGARIKQVQDTPEDVFASVSRAHFYTPESVNII